MKKKNILTFKEYYEKYRTPLAHIAAKCGLTFSQVYHLLKGGCPTLKTAITLERYTEGEVSCETLLPKSLMDEIIEQEKKKI